MYTCDIIIVHIILSIALFFIVNWLGLHAISVGYMQMSVVIKEDTAPAFNFLFKVLAPPIYIMCCSIPNVVFGSDEHKYFLHCYILLDLSFNLGSLNRSRTLD